MSTDKSNYTPIFGDRLKRVRKQLGLTQQELADLCYIAKDTLSRYERGLLTPSIEVFYKIYSALLEKDRGLTVHELLFENAEEDYTRYRVKNLGKVESLIFHGGGKVLTSYDSSDICTFLSALVTYERDQKNPSVEVIKSLEKLRARYFDKKFIFETEAFIAAFEAAIKPKPSYAYDEYKRK